MQKSISTLVATLCLAIASTAALAQSTHRETKGGSDYERSMQQAGMSGMSGMSGMTGTTKAPAEKAPSSKKAKSKKKAKPIAAAPAAEAKK